MLAVLHMPDRIKPAYEHAFLASLWAQAELANEMADADAVLPRKKSEIELMRQIDQVTSRPCSCICSDYVYSSCMFAVESRLALELFNRGSEFLHPSYILSRRML